MRQMRQKIVNFTIVLVIIGLCAGLVTGIRNIYMSKQQARHELIGETIIFKPDGLKSQVSLTITSVTNARPWGLAYVVVKLKITKDPLAFIEIKRDPWDWANKVSLIENSSKFEIPSKMNYKGWEIYIYYDGNFEIK